MDNLAFNRPALQSSVCAWSSSHIPAEAARGGNDGDLSRDLGVHTDRERDPWWQVDLQGTFTVDQVCLFNRDTFPERLVRFSVLGSLDGVVWDILASKSNDQVFGPDGVPFVLDLPQRPSLRHLRVRLDGINCLHFKECRVFGVPADPDAAVPTDIDVRDPKRIVFSVLYNESDGFLAAYLANFLHYTGEESVLLVNLQPGHTIPDTPPSERIVVFNGSIQRYKSGHTLLMGHLEAYALALSRFEEFNYFCPLASNSLFVRRFNPAAAVRQLRAGHKVPTDLDITYDIGLDIDRLPGSWHWPKIACNQPLITFLKECWNIEQLSQNQIEGLMASRTDWGLLHARLPEFPSMGSLVPQDGWTFLPLEEVLPSTFFLSFGTGRYVNICHVFWNRFNHTGSGQVTTDELLAFGHYPAHLCVIKWFERDAWVLETAAVTQSWSQALLANFMSATSNHGARERLLQRLLLENVVAALRRREVATAFSARWCSPPDRVSPPCSFRDPFLSAVGQTVHLPTGYDGPYICSDAHLYLDPTQHELDLSIHIEHEAGTQIRIACTKLDAAPKGSMVLMLEGFIYLRASSHGGKPLVRVRVLKSQASYDRVIQKIVVMREGSPKQIAPLHAQPCGEFIDFLFSNDDPVEDSGFWFGVPILANLQFEVELALIQDGFLID